jgi:hypothetical protein
MGIQVLEGNALLCDVRCLGVVHESNHRTELQWNRLFWQICSSHRALAANQSIEGFLWTPIQLAPLQLRDEVRERELRSGDVVCSCREEFSAYDSWLVLRPTQLVSQTYTLVGLAEPETRGHYSFDIDYGDDSGDTVVIANAQDFRSCPKIQVRII